MFEMFSDALTSSFSYFKSHFSSGNDEIVETRKPVDLEEKNGYEFHTDLTDSENKSDEEMDAETPTSYFSASEEKIGPPDTQESSGILDESDSFSKLSEDETKNVQLESHVDEVNYPSAGETLTAKLKEMVDAGELKYNPAGILRMIAENTNPGWLMHSFWNLVTIPKQCYEQWSLKPLFGFNILKNCVHCARAVEQTLDKLFSYATDSTTNLEIKQVHLGGAASANTLHCSGHTKILEITEGEQDKYLDALEKCVKPGQRANITAPVASKNGAISHAMNFVNLGPAEGSSENRAFILCGQSGRVYDLTNEADKANFHHRYAWSEHTHVRYTLVQ